MLIPHTRGKGFFILPERTQDAAGNLYLTAKDGFNHFFCDSARTEYHRLPVAKIQYGGIRRLSL